MDKIIVGEVLASDRSGRVTVEKVAFDGGRRSSLLEIVEVFGSDKKEKCESIILGINPTNQIYLFNMSMSLIIYALNHD